MMSAERKRREKKDAGTRTKKRWPSVSAGAFLAALLLSLPCSLETVIPPAAAAPLSEAAAEAKIEELGAKIQEREAALSEVQRRDAEIIEALDAAGVGGRSAKDDVVMAKAAIRASSDALKMMEGDLQATKDAYRAQMDIFSPRLLAMQKLMKGGNGHLLESAGSLSQLLWRRRALEMILAADMRWLRRAQSTLHTLETKSSALEKAQAIHQKRLEEASEKDAVSCRRRSELESTHAQLISERQALERQLQALEAAQENLRRQIEEMKSGGAEAAVIVPDLFAAGHKGHLTFPTKGFIEVGFGRIVNPKFNTVTFQNGLDIRAAKGSPVVAVFSGKVVHASFFRGYGNLIILDHGEGYHSLYAHMEGLIRSVGEEVGIGDVIGAVGDTGSDKGAFLHFELRHHGQPVDPKDWFGGF